MKSIWEKPMASWRSRVFALALMAGAAFPAWSQNAIQSINSSQQAGSEVIRIELSEAARRGAGRASPSRRRRGSRSTCRA